MKRAKRKLAKQRLVKRGKPKNADSLVVAGIPTRWPKGVSGNPSGNGVGFKEFVERCRQTTPQVLKVLVQALSLPPLQKNWRWKLFAASELANRSWGKAPQLIIDAPTGDKQPVRIEMTEEYWSQFVAALKESGALEKRVEVDAEVVEVAAAPDAKPDDPKLLN